MIPRPLKNRPPHLVLYKSKIRGQQFSQTLPEPPCVRWQRPRNTQENVTRVRVSKTAVLRVAPFNCQSTVLVSITIARWLRQLTGGLKNNFHAQFEGYSSRGMASPLWASDNAAHLRSGMCGIQIVRLFRKRKRHREDAGPHMPLGSSPQGFAAV